ncbi:hypothetical protein [Raoultella ornithinolytica]|uniref:hypothetical protein n=1 Tax=Raoultella ornithinolytica TaxID=54291 RepID=UPI001265BCA5|nr:hypothetical protein [Raoultella ornithinolytica]KAB8155485.1 hypothetical protein FNV36_21560 [Raoultella ornithinolytica]KAB8169557.1 hypothetical protein FNV35_11355 [Raoultella ornithinolytica]MDN3781105.1 hypothetical protein [Raoultella ornithinolytica]QWU11727.1 hypothetical protein KP007_07945 [Raoultella ornithinolytica]
MTTTVYDRINKLIASDSRWSCDLTQRGYPGHVLYIDNTGFGKIADRNDFVMTLAGDGLLIEQWKKWWAGDLSDQEPPVVLPTGQSVVLHIVKKSTNEVVFDKGNMLAAACSQTKELQAVFSGSGGGHAAQDWMTNHCARTAIDAAKHVDPFTGGSVRFVDFASGMADLEASVQTISEVNQALLMRGLIMDTKNPHVQHVSISAQEVADVRQMLINGNITPCAPIGKKTQDWDDASKQRLSAAIKRIREEEAI